MTDSDQAPALLRVGLLTSGALRQWQSLVVDSIRATDRASVELIVQDGRDRYRADLRSRFTSGNAVWDLFNNRRVARVSRALDRNRDETLAGVPTIECVVEKRGKWSEYFSDEDIERIKSYDLDVLIRFGFGIIRGEILEAARYGVWSFHHDDDDVVRGGPPAFWEIVDGHDVTGTVLQRLTDRLDGGQILHKGWFRTTPSSYVRNTDTVHLGAVDWPARLCRQIAAGDVGAADGVPSTSTAPIRRKPTDSQTARFLAKQAVSWTKAQANGLTIADEWEVGIVDAPIHRFLDQSFRPVVRWLGLASHRGTYAADPFHLELDGSPMVLYERFESRRRTGEIWTADLDGGSPRPSGLPLDAHASYPFVVEAVGVTFCVPQVAGQRLRAFSWSDGGWSPGPFLGPDRPVLDGTIVEHDGKWWLFATLPGEWSLTHLHIWWAEKFDGPWHPHLLNPVKSDVRSARPAGTPFTHEGSLYRPAQDGSLEYGGAVSINEVVALTPERFEERVVRTVRPDPDWPFSAGLHTLSAAGGQTLIDAKRHRFDLNESRAELTARVRKLGQRR